MPEWLNQQNITFVIAVLSFFLSLSSWVRDYYVHRQKLKFEITGIKSYADVTFIYLIVTNCSRSPVSITQIALLMDDAKYACASNPVLVAEHTRSCGGEVYERRMEYSTAMPIQIDGLGSTSALVLFENLKRLPPDDARFLNFSVRTNRGKPIQTKLQLPVAWASQREEP